MKRKCTSNKIHRHKQLSNNLIITLIKLKKYGYLKKGTQGGSADAK